MAREASLTGSEVRVTTLHVFRGGHWVKVGYLVTRAKRAAHATAVRRAVRCLEKQHGKGVDAAPTTIESSLATVIGQHEPSLSFQEDVVREASDILEACGFYLGVPSVIRW